MFRLPFRLFSANWVSTVLDDFVPSATLFLKTYPPSKKTMIVTGPLGSGKSTAIDIAYASANESGKIDMLMTIPIGETLKEVKQPEDQEDEQETDQNEIDHMLVVNSVNQSVVQMLEFVNKKDVPDEINKEIVAVLKHYAKKLISLCEKIDKSLVDEPDAASFLEVRKEEKKIGIEILNDKLKEYKKVIKLTALEYSALSHIIENVTVPDAFDIVATGILSFRAEENFGELSTALTVNILNLVGKYCVSKQMACPILRIDDCHLMYHTPFTIDYFKLLIEEIVTSKAYFYTIIEGAGVFSDVLSLIVQYKDDFDWYNIKDNDFKNFVSGLDQEAPGLSEISKTNL